MEVLITGGAGYVGSRVTGHLLREGADVIVLDRLIYSGEALISLLDQPQFRFVAGDIRQGDVLQSAMEGRNSVIHLAALVGEDACSLDEAATVAINRQAAIDTLRRAEASGIERFIFLSTCSNYGVSDPDVLADEESPLRPLSLYARTKVEVEQACLAHSGRMAVTVLRFGTICGLAARMRFDLLISEMARAAATGQGIEIYKPDAWRPFLHIADAGRAMWHVLNAPRERVAGQVFNVVGENLSKRHLMEIVQRHYPTTPIAITDRKPDNRDYRVSGARVEAQLGFKPRHTIEAAFVETANAVRLGLFNDAAWPGHSAIPLPNRRALIGLQTTG